MPALYKVFQVIPHIVYAESVGEATDYAQKHLEGNFVSDMTREITDLSQLDGFNHYS